MNIPMSGAEHALNNSRVEKSRNGIQMRINTQKELADAFKNPEFDAWIKKEIAAGNAKNPKEIIDAIRNNMKNNKEFRAEQRLNKSHGSHGQQKAA